MVFVHVGFVSFCVSARKINVYIFPFRLFTFIYYLNVLAY